MRDESYYVVNTWRTRLARAVSPAWFLMWLALDNETWCEKEREKLLELY